MRAELKTLFLLSLALTLNTFLGAVNDDAGTTGFATLKIIYSARANAMGQALMGVVKNPDGMQFNPASIIRMEDSQVSSTFMNYYSGANGGSVQFIKAQDTFSAWGVMLKYLNFGSMERTEVSQNGDLIETGESFGAQNIIAGYTMSRFLSPLLDLGGIVKVVFDQIDDKSATAALLDLGLIHHPANQKIKVGAGIRNLGKQLSYYNSNKYNESLPFTMAAGISYQFNDRVLSSFDLSKSTGENFVAKLGLEYLLNQDFILRTGFKSNAGDGNVGGAWGWTSGLSAGAAWNWNNVRLNYSLASTGDLGAINQLSIDLNF